MVMIRGPKLTPSQWKILSTAFSNIAQAVILFSGAAFFVPEVVNLSRDFSKIIALGFFLGGFFFLCISVIIAKRGN